MNENLIGISSFLKTTPSRLFHEWASGGMQEEFINGKRVKEEIPENFGFHGHSSISLIQVTKKIMENFLFH
jgi:hypothetical protein